MGDIGHGGKQREVCVIMYHRLITRRRVKLSDLAKELGVSYDTAYRWAESFGHVLDLRIERGIAIVDQVARG